MHLERYCRKCNKEILRDGDVGTFYEGKEWCKCKNESLKPDDPYTTFKKTKS